MNGCVCTLREIMRVREHVDDPRHAGRKRHTPGNSDLMDED